LFETADPTLGDYIDKNAKSLEPAFGTANSTLGGYIIKKIAKL
jgi:hypothetical protein